MRRRLIIILLLSLFLSGSGNKVFAQWISPGKLAKAHRELSGMTSCLKCHTLTRGLDNAACKLCHKELNKKIKENKGLHARVKGECVPCHPDHKGEDYDIASLDKESFNHSLTGYELHDSHKIACNKCHKNEETYLGLSPECLGCHTDAHKRTVSENCIQCHNYQDWTALVFDHSKSAEYKLTGKHLDVKCELCHPRNSVIEKAGDTDKVYQVLILKPIKSKKCSDCHYDLHKGQLKKQKCDACHSVKKEWKDYMLDHESEKFNYKLKGRHKEVECEKCHERSEVRYTEFKREKKAFVCVFKELESDECSNCHYDIHKGQFKDQKCDACHSVKKEWKDYMFDHESEKFSYKLEGRHKEVECEKCHERSEVRYTEFKREKKAFVSVFKYLESDECSNCHYDIHKGQFKDQKCDACHSVKQEWENNTFSHESENYRGYKIEGKHVDVECVKCHKRSEFSYTEFNRKKKVLAGTFKPLQSKKCNDCHKDDHKGVFKEIEMVQSVTCSNCHSVEKEWKDYIYKHKEDSRYHKYNPGGQVKESKCQECHVCSEEVFCISCCFENMGQHPTR